MARQRSAKPFTAVRICSVPQSYFRFVIAYCIFTSRKAGRDYFMKYSQLIGIAAAVLLIVSCFLPWTFYPDVNKHFTGFYSEGNNYGKPGMLFSGLAVLATAFFLIPRVWAKRWNLLIGALVLAWAIRSFILFSGCYRGICPTKEIGIWLMVVAAGLLLLMTFFPDTAVKQDANKKSI